MLKPVLASTLVAFAGAAFAEPHTFNVDLQHSGVTFEALHMNTSTTRGRILVKEGTITLDRAAKTGKADVTLDMNTVSTAVPSLEGALKGERIFNVAQNPTARFVGDSVAFDGDKVASVTGTLTIAGKTQPATLKAIRFNCYENRQLKRDVCGGDFETTISRSAFGIAFLPQVTPDTIPLLIQVEAVHQ
jgi:polyisoprenoid-binding protein YceI